MVIKSVSIEIRKKLIRIFFLNAYFSVLCSFGDNLFDILSFWAKMDIVSLKYTFCSVF